MEKKTLTLSKKAFEILDSLIRNEFTDRAFEIACENFDTFEEAEENIRAYAEIFKAFGDDDDRYKDVVILKMPCYTGNTSDGFYYFAEWNEHYKNYDVKSIELIKKITL